MLTMSEVVLALGLFQPLVTRCTGMESWGRNPHALARLRVKTVMKVVVTFNFTSFFTVLGVGPRASHMVVRHFLGAAPSVCLLWLVCLVYFRQSLSR